MRPLRIAGALTCAVVSIASTALGAVDQPADPGAIAAVKQYVAALGAGDTGRAYALLTPAQQRYFGNVRNFASNYQSTGYHIERWSVAATHTHTATLAEIDVDQTTSFFDIAAARTMQARTTEPYFAIESAGHWGVKEIYVPWKSYAPKTQGRSGGLQVIVDRVEFFDRRVQVDCTLRNVGSKPLQVLPLLKSTFALGGETGAALADPDFPLNDHQFYDGVRLYPMHQVVGFINFPLRSRTDRTYSARLVVGPAVEDGATSPTSVPIGPIPLPKL